MDPNKAIRTRVELEADEKQELKREKQHEYTQKAQAHAKEAKLKTKETIEALQCDESLMIESSIRTIQRNVKAIYDEFFYMLSIDLQASLLDSLLMHPQLQEATKLAGLSNSKERRVN